MPTKGSATTQDTQIVIGPNGVVLGATGALSAGLLDKPVGECDELLPEIKKAATALLAELRQSPGRVVSVLLRLDDARQVEIVAIEALAIRERRST